MTTVRVLDPTRDELGRVLDALYPGIVASAALDQPYEPAPTVAAWRSQLLTPWFGDDVRLVVAEEGHLPVGSALVFLSMHDNRHLALVEMHVQLSRRRRGLGRRLWQAAERLVRDAGRTTMIVEARCGSAMEAFAAAMGLSPELTDVRRHQPLRELDPVRVEALRRDAERAAAGYRLEVWSGPTPERLRAALASASMTLNDAPLGGLDVTDEVWDAERVAQRDGAVAGAGLRMHGALALAPDGAAAGFTEVMVSEDGTYAWQAGTGVAPAHRGHRLGLLLKATLVQRLRELEPRCEVVATWNADSNPHMIAVNEALGYVPVDTMAEWQLVLAAPATPP